MALIQGRFYLELGARVRRAREDASLSQEDLAKSIGVSRSSIANIETGRQPIYVEALVRVAEVLKTPILKLIPFHTGDSTDTMNAGLDHLADDQRHWVTRVLMTSANKKEKDETKVFTGKKKGRRAT
jgi:transcriptional regulator with XRE-family HTH domain